MLQHFRIHFGPLFAPSNARSFSNSFNPNFLNVNFGFFKKQIVHNNVVRTPSAVNTVYCVPPQVWRQKQSTPNLSAEKSAQQKGHARQRREKNRKLICASLLLPFPSFPYQTSSCTGFLCWCSWFWLAVMLQKYGWSNFQSETESETELVMKKSPLRLPLPTWQQRGPGAPPAARLLGYGLICLILTVIVKLVKAGSHCH